MKRRKGRPATALHKSASFPPYPPLCTKPHCRAHISKEITNHPTRTICSGLTTPKVLRGEPFFRHWEDGVESPQYDPDLNMTVFEYLDDIILTGSTSAKPKYMLPTLYPPLFRPLICHVVGKRIDNVPPEEAYVVGEYYANTYDRNRFNHKFRFSIHDEAADSIDDLAVLPGPEERVWRGDMIKKTKPSH